MLCQNIGGEQLVFRLQAKFPKKGAMWTTQHIWHIRIYSESANTMAAWTTTTILSPQVQHQFYIAHEVQRQSWHFVHHSWDPNVLNCVLQQLDCPGAFMIGKGPSSRLLCSLQNSWIFKQSFQMMQYTRMARPWTTLAPGIRVLFHVIFTCYLNSCFWLRRCGGVAKKIFGCRDITRPISQAQGYYCTSSTKAYIIFSHPWASNSSIRITAIFRLLGAWNLHPVRSNSTYM